MGQAIAFNYVGGNVYSFISYLLILSRSILLPLMEVYLTHEVRSAILNTFFARCGGTHTHCCKRSHSKGSQEAGNALAPAFLQSGGENVEGAAVSPAFLQSGGKSEAGSPAFPQCGGKSEAVSLAFPQSSGGNEEGAAVIPAAPSVSPAFPESGEKKAETTGSGAEEADGIQTPKSGGETEGALASSSLEPAA